MTALPQFVRRLPYVFYALAIIVVGWRYYNDWSVVAASMQYATDAGSMITIARSTALYWGAVEAVYMVANGAMLHVLIAIYDKVQGK